MSSYTAIMRKQLTEAKNLIITSRHISTDRYNEMIFVYGCRFAEVFSKEFINNVDICDQLTTNPEWGFWDWFRLKWVQDDKEILTVSALRAVPYETLKETMIGDDLLTSELLHYINHLLYVLPCQNTRQ